MRFQDLNPKISENDIIFDCPKCGKPYKIWIAAKFRTPASNGTWCWDHDGENVTITPSILFHLHGRKPCGWHGSVTNGEVTGA